MTPRKIDYLQMIHDDLTRELGNLVWTLDTIVLRIVMIGIPVTYRGVAISLR